MVTYPVHFRGHTFAFPDDWLIDQDDENLVAALPEPDGPFGTNIIVSVAPNEESDPLAGIGQLAGSVVLSVGRFAAALPAVEVVFGYPLDTAAVTVVRLLGDPSPAGRLIVTLSVDAARFAEQWPTAGAVLRSIEETL